MSPQFSLVKKIKIALKKLDYIYTIRNLFTQIAVRKRFDLQKQIPEVQLKQKNIANLKTLLNREELLKNLPSNKVVAEIGVDSGEFSALILRIASPVKLHLIDAWEGGRYSSNLKSIVENKFSNEIDQGLIKTDVGYSTEVLKSFPDGYFDWVYLDTDHSYLVTKNELEVLKSKVKIDGIIAGHDYITYDWVGKTRYGVIEAVNEFCVNENWELIFLTAETNQYRSYAIRQIIN